MLCKWFFGLLKSINLKVYELVYIQKSIFNLGISLIKLNKFFLYIKLSMQLALKDLNNKN